MQVGELRQLLQLALRRALEIEPEEALVRYVRGDVLVLGIDQERHRQAIARRRIRRHGTEAISFVLEPAGRYTAADLDLAGGAGLEEGLCAIA